MKKTREIRMVSFAIKATMGQCNGYQAKNAIFGLVVEKRHQIM